MSGGYFSYTDQELCNNIFGIDPSLAGGPTYKSGIKLAIFRDPMEDREISELVYDVICLLHEFDYYQEYDTSRESYLAAKKRFKKKWFSTSPDKRLQTQLGHALSSIDQAASKAKNNLKEMFDGE